MPCPCFNAVRDMGIRVLNSRVFFKDQDEDHIGQMLGNGKCRKGIS